uniref:Uncharacterized protein n=1 Tax=Cajanus cajan TaxID=3821 RepID=A0A151RDN1_CAJCA|nr:hypothetical protein KK1_038081 [Cajanus cajan]
MGKHQKIAMEIAAQEFNRLSCSKLDLEIKNSHGNSLQTVSSGKFISNILYLTSIPQRIMFYSLCVCLVSHSH